MPNFHLSSFEIYDQSWTKMPCLLPLEWNSKWNLKWNPNETQIAYSEHPYWRSYLASQHTSPTVIKHCITSRMRWKWSKTNMVLKWLVLPIFWLSPLMPPVYPAVFQWSKDVWLLGQSNLTQLRWVTIWWSLFNISQCSRPNLFASTSRTAQIHITFFQIYIISIWCLHPLRVAWRCLRVKTPLAPMF